jgi:hypothetical protein
MGTPVSLYRGVVAYMDVGKEREQGYRSFVVAAFFGYFF